jgi:hypothetical protein
VEELEGADPPADAAEEAERHEERDARRVRLDEEVGALGAFARRRRRLKERLTARQGWSSRKTEG